MQVNLNSNGIQQPLLDLSAKALPALLWHYTDGDGYLGILRTKSLWASDCRYLNDSREYLEGVSRIASAVKSMVPASGLARDLSLEALSAAEEAELVPGTIHALESSVSQFVVVTCFSAARDDLSQWRAYGGQGPRFALGFDSTALKALAHSELALLAGVVYSPEEQAALALDIGESIISMARITAPDDNVSSLDGQEMPKQKFLLYAVINMMLGAALMKGASFAAEAEYRMLSIRPLYKHGPLRYRMRRSLLVPYVEMPSAQAGAPNGTFPEPTEIIAGPSPHPSLLLRSAIHAATDSSIRCKCTPSSVSFRDW